MSLMRDLIGPAVLVASCFWIYNAWFVSRSQPSGDTNRAFFAPVSPLEARSLNTNINGISEGQRQDKVMSIDTRSALYTIDTLTGSVRSCISHVVRGDQRCDFAQENDSSCSISPLEVVLEDDNVVQFSHYEIEELDRAYAVTFHNEEIGLEKKLILYHDKAQVDLILNADAAFRDQIVRVVIPSMHDKEPLGMLSVAVRNGDSLDFIAAEKVELRKGWLEPTIFGTANRYFAHVLFGSKDGFVQRGYFSRCGDSGTIAFLEGGLASSSQAWMSYYMGPRDTAHLAEADASLIALSSSNGYLSGLTDLIAFILNKLAQYAGGVGWALIWFVFLTRLVLFPFSLPAKDRHSDLERRLQYIQNKYKDDAERLALERMKLWSNSGLGANFNILMLVASIMEIPLIIAIRSIIANSFLFYQSSFLWIPDLGSPDPFYVLPSLFILGFAVQALAGPKQGRMFKLSFSLLAMTIFPKFSAGLLLYLLVSMVLRLSLPLLFEEAKKRVSFA